MNLNYRNIATRPCGFLSRVTMLMFHSYGGAWGIQAGSEREAEKSRDWGEISSVVCLSGSNTVLFHNTCNVQCVDNCHFFQISLFWIHHISLSNIWSGLILSLSQQGVGGRWTMLFALAKHIYSANSKAPMETNTLYRHDKKSTKRS